MPSDERAIPSAARAIGEAIRQLRRQRAWSIEVLAERADVSYQYVSEIETGKCNFSILILEKIARGLEVSMLALMDRAYPGLRASERLLPQAA
jgi:transcriptional regulator with XRE-family HTH domain